MKTRRIIAYALFGLSCGFASNLMCMESRYQQAEQDVLDLAIRLSLEDAQKASKKTNNQQATSKIDEPTLAASRGDFARVQELINQQVGEPDYNKALEIAIKNRFYYPLETLINLADKSTEILSAGLMDIIQQDPNQASTLIYVIAIIAIETPIIQPKKIFNNALKIAALVGNQELVKYLLALDADDYGSALLQAKKNNHQHIVDLLNNHSKNLESAKANKQESVIQKLEKTSDVTDTANEDLLCPICLEKESNVKTICKHEFCDSCFNEWLEKNNCCPTCREEIIK